MPCISKRAFLQEKIKDAVMSIWRDDQGPAENLLRLVSYAPSLFGVSGMMVTGLDKVLSEYGYGLEDFGRWMDESGLTDTVLGSFSFAEVNNDNKIQKVADSMVNDKIMKEAIWGAAFRLIWKLINPKNVIKILWTALKAVLLAFGFTKIGELYDAAKGGFAGLTEKGVKEKVEEVTELFESSPKDPSLNPKYYGPEGYEGPRS